MSRCGFRCLKSTTEICALYEYNGEFGETESFHDSVCSLINKAETKRKLGLYQMKELFSIVTPFFIKSFIKKIMKKYKMDVFLSFKD